MLQRSIKLLVDNEIVIKYIKLFFISLFANMMDFYNPYEYNNRRNFMNLKNYLVLINFDFIKIYK